jgi:hypothetical protein
MPALRENKKLIIALTSETGLDELEQWGDVEMFKSVNSIEEEDIIDRARDDYGLTLPPELARRIISDHSGDIRGILQNLALLREYVASQSVKNGSSGNVQC